MSLKKLEASLLLDEEYAQLFKELYDKLSEALLIEAQIGTHIADGDLGKLASRAKECRDLLRQLAQTHREQYVVWAGLYAELEEIRERKKA